MKIQNKYSFRTVISEFIYFQKTKKKTHESSMVARPTTPESSAWI